eukprot:NODE_23867_length_648_cov_2.913628.p3 GENE.NODE_23867_length_648_cov_2.913628~~NODE_23867_length_648_cov_2.913628.p3  ORF type:complete len:70 (+),score=12.21 NODE_23867_length_648_cov_2.913628:332-541(+)
MNAGKLPTKASSWVMFLPAPLKGVVGKRQSAWQHDCSADWSSCPTYQLQRLVSTPATDSGGMAAVLHHA